MDWHHRIQILAILLVFTVDSTWSNELGSSCSRDRDCKVSNSHCVSGICDCQHYYARFNSTSCLESKLLGQDCKIDQQCFLRVANSVCKQDACQCTDGFIKFRKHTCLEPAAPGSVCYSDEHCQMWSKSTHCKFIITNLFGKCECKDKDNCDGEMTAEKPAEESAEIDVSVDTSDETEKPETENETSEETSGNVSANVNQEEDEENAENSWADENKAQPFADPFSQQKQHLTENNSQEEIENDPVTEYDEEVLTNAESTTQVPESIKNSMMEMNLETTTTTETTSNEVEVHESAETNTTDAILNEATTTTTTPNELKYRIEANDNERQDQYSQQKKAISLGFPCEFDSQCQRQDSESRCVDGVCDCVVKAKENSCGKNNTGCPKETFQCPSSGLCVSWFFVCDGRRDCPDGSDEDCNGPVCPRSSFQCGANGTCVSLSVLCDGTKNCPNGEDEQFCLPEQRKPDQGCPKDTFQCSNGRCLPKYEFCNAIPKCADGSDESSPLCRSQGLNRYLGMERTRTTNRYCPFRCANGRCRSTAILCSGRDGCGDNSDEARCSVCRCSKIPKVSN